VAKVRFNYGVLKALDMVVCGGSSPFAVITRIVTAGWKQFKNSKISVHTGILVDFHGQLLVAEMGSRGLGINSLERYNTLGARRYIIAFRRNLIYNDANTKKAVQERIAHDVRHTLDYDFKGLIEHVTSRVADNPNRAYCSEYVYQTTKENIKYPEAFAEKVSPLDLQKCACGWVDVGGVFV
jgi:hypothetical protein